MPRLPRLLFALAIAALLPACPPRLWEFETDITSDSITLDAAHPIAHVRVNAHSTGRAAGCDDLLAVAPRLQLQGRQIVRMAVSSTAPAEPIRFEKFFSSTGIGGSQDAPWPRYAGDRGGQTLICDDKSKHCEHAFDVSLELVAPADSPQSTTVSLEAWFELMCGEGSEPSEDAAVTMDVSRVR